MMSGPDAKFGCMITPRQEALAKAQEFLKQWSQSARTRRGTQDVARTVPLEAGKQDIEVYGLDPRTRAARILVEADYRMKLVGMGLEDGVPGVVSYLNLIKGPPPPMGVLRWWFTLELRGDRGVEGPAGVRLLRPGREGRKRERAPDRPGPADPHRRVGDA